MNTLMKSAGGITQVSADSRLLAKRIVFLEALTLNELHLFAAKNVTIYISGLQICRSTQSALYQHYDKHNENQRGTARPVTDRVGAL